MWQYKQTYTQLATTHRILNFIKGDYFFGIGRHEGGPQLPTPPNTLVDIPSPVLYKKAYEVKPALKSPCGNKVLYDATGQEQIWQVFNDPTVIEGSIHPTHVYVNLHLSDDEYQAQFYSCLGLFEGLRVREGVERNISYLPRLVIDPGILIWVCFHTPVYRIPGSRGVRIVEFMLEV